LPRPDPPFCEVKYTLDEAGFGSAARWYVDGFSRRSGIKVNLNLAPKLDRMHRDVELALFRAVQEALTNIHRHSGASMVDIHLTVGTEQLQLEIKDDGRGIPRKRLTSLIEGAAETGLGLAGMRERMREVGGSLEIRSDRTGTTVVISIPVERNGKTEFARCKIDGKHNRQLQNIPRA
jgi:two-component system, NarL family, sensor kinase